MILNTDEYEVRVISEQYDYAHAPGSSINYVSVKAEAEDPNAKVEISGDGLFTGLDDVVASIKVTAEDDSVAVYRFTFRSSATDEAMRSDASIRVLEVLLLDGTLLPFTQAFSPSIFTYILNVPDGTSQVSYNG